ncbi:unnamed protein product [Cercopithifilaria johnstoni]|uniref:Uncharacterized protein n=1 Tax=Cercopithifilaria johnstoni TaxID=2874296 RepID=A0A8J2LLA3_9BILA|nr:unnamed protein product [Cercopithifilaria johnstoni]
MLQVEVMPGCGIRNDYIELLLGMPINQAIAAIKNASRHIQNVELTYSSKEPLSRDVMIRLAKDGVRLYFEPNSQLLRLIEVYDLSNIVLQYGGVVFSSPKDEADVNKVEGCFGATHPGVYVAEQSLYELSWKGLSFSFPTLNETSKVQTASVDATGLGSLQFRSNSPPLLAKMAIYPDSYNSPKPPKISAASLCGVICPVEVKSISDGSRISGLSVVFAAETPVADSSSRKQAFGLRKIERSIFFGDTSESVLSSLGAPSKVFYTKADRMLIHRGEDSKKLRGPRPNYFFNYFSLGVDILFDCITNRVQKFVLHTNLPGHFDFGIYARCNFCITITDGPTITPSSKRENFFGAFCGDTTVQPVVLSRSGTENPFGSTFCYGTDQVIVEVMDNGFIASVTLF